MPEAGGAREPAAGAGAGLTLAIARVMNIERHRGDCDNPTTIEEGRKPSMLDHL